MMSEFAISMIRSVLVVRCEGKELSVQASFPDARHADALSKIAIAWISQAAVPTGQPKAASTPMQAGECRGSRSADIPPGIVGAGEGFVL